jgi:hypothetical protein
MGRHFVRETLRYVLAHGGALDDGVESESLDHVDDARSKSSRVL